MTKPQTIYALRKHTTHEVLSELMKFPKEALVRLLAFYEAN